MISLDILIPDSPSDFGAILVWVMIILLGIIVSIDIRTFLSYRRMSQKTKRSQQSINVDVPVNTLKEDRFPDIVEIQNKVDKLIEAYKL
ncbi:MAG TPA: hypothetical protein HA258_03305 [Thermoplasmata archaeon]|nr:hypothetical protein [Thermoplasmata archaeon]